MNTIIRKICVVEDEVSIRRILEIKMKSVGYEVLGFDNAAEALDAIRTECPDLIVTDYRMPGAITGADLIRAVRQIESINEVPIILLSGSVAVLRQLQERLADHSNITYMSKPFSPRILAAEIEKIFLTCT